MNQREMVLCFLFKTNKWIAEVVEKGMSNFDHPATSLEVGIEFYFFALLTSESDIGNVLTLLKGLGITCIASVQTEILGIFLT